jgi:hypothetical protein
MPPLENLTGNVYIDSLNEAWPAGTDLPDAGDDHLRGIKNVLKRSFPNITGPVNLTQDQINQGSIPAGSVLPFYQATPPVGWSRVGGISQTFGLRIAASATAGGVSGGTDDPVLNDKVPSHTHGYSGSTASDATDHSHYFSATSGNMNQNVSHNHSVSDPGHTHSGSTLTGGAGFAGGGAAALGSIGPSVTGISLGGASIDHAHAVAGSTGGRSASHSHSYSGATVANASAASWVPRYLDLILCVRDAA